MPVPETGRQYRTVRKVRLGDVRASGRLRLDALARYLQDVANDDAMDAELDGAMSWVVRRVTIAVYQWPVFADHVELVTFCGAIGSRFAERRTSILVDGVLRADADALWVFFDPASGRPAVLGPQFLQIYGEAAGGRRASSRLTHPAPPDGARRRPWPQRTTDYDLLGHTNNAIGLAAVEEVVGEGGVPAEVEVEYRDAIEPGDEVHLVTAAANGRDLEGQRQAIGPASDLPSVALWLTVAGQVRFSARMLGAGLDTGLGAGLETDLGAG